MKDLTVIEVPMNNPEFSDGDRYCMTERNERYYLAYETNILKRISVLWTDLKFIRKSFGVDRMNGHATEESIFTHESINHTRKIAIAEMKKAIEMGIQWQDLEYLNEDGTWKLVNGFITDQYDNKKAGLVPYTPRNLSKHLQALYEADIDKGLYVVCKAVEM